MFLWVVSSLSIIIVSMIVDVMIDWQISSNIMMIMVNVIVLIICRLWLLVCC